MITKGRLVRVKKLVFLSLSLAIAGITAGGIALLSSGFLSVLANSDVASIDCRVPAYVVSRAGFAALDVRMMPNESLNPDGADGIHDVDSVIIVTRYPELQAATVQADKRHELALHCNGNS